MCIQCLKQSPVQSNTRNVSSYDHHPIIILIPGGWIRSQPGGRAPGRAPGQAQGGGLSTWTATSIELLAVSIPSVYC